MPMIIHGKGISPGLAEGITHIHRDAPPLPDLPDSIETKDVDQEFHHLERSTALITDNLLALAARVEQEMNANLAAVFDTHQQMLNDPVLKTELRAEIRENLVSASCAVKTVFQRWERRFLEMESRMAQQKGADMRDISNRLSNALAGVHIHPLEQIPPGSVLVARRLLPSDTMILLKCSVAAVLLEHGHAGSHAALFVRAMGLPCIVNIRDILSTVPANVRALVNADVGDVLLHPSKADEARFRRTNADRRRSLTAAHARAREPAITRDGLAIAVLANVGCREDVERAMENGADGIGLYRTEQTYMGRMNPPDADELFDEMRHILDPARGKQICIRLLDAGADKRLPFMGFLAETNPALGCRGIRLLHRHPALLETQLRAILKLRTAENAATGLVQLFRPPDQSRQRAGAGQIAGRMAGEHRRRRAGARGLSGGRRTRLHDARRRGATDAGDAPFLCPRAARSRVRCHRTQGFLLSLPRHDERAARVALRTVERGQRVPARRHVGRRRLLPAADGGGRRNPPARRRVVSQGRLAMDAERGGGGESRLDAREGLSALPLARLRRSADHLSARAGFADAPAAGRELSRLGFDV
jgi:phosphohistidine swiveling domain-containing protein